MSGNCIFYDGKTEARASEFAAPAFIYTIEALEEVRQVLRLDALTIVADGEKVGMTAVVIGFNAGDAEGGCTGGVGNDIVDEIAENAVYQACIAVEFYAGGGADGGRDASLLQLQGGVFEHVMNDGQNVRLTEFVGGVRMTVLHLVQLRQGTHVEQQFVHPFALGIAALKEMLALVLRHIGIVENALQVTMNAGSRGLEFVGCILRQLPFNAKLVLLRVAEFPIELDDGVADVAQLVVRQSALQFVIQLVALFCLVRKLTKIADVAANAVGVEKEHHAEKQRQDDGEIDEGVVGSERFGQFGRIWHRRTDNEIVEARGRVEIRLVGGLAPTLDVVTIAMLQGLLNLMALKVIGERIGIVVVVVLKHSPVCIDDGYTKSLDGVAAGKVVKLGIGEQTVLAQRLHHLVVEHLQA